MACTTPTCLYSFLGSLARLVSLKPKIIFECTNVTACLGLGLLCFFSLFSLLDLATNTHTGRRVCATCLHRPSLFGGTKNLFSWCHSCPHVLQRRSLEIDMSLEFARNVNISLDLARDNQGCYPTCRKKTYKIRRKPNGCASSNLCF